MRGIAKDKGDCFADHRDAGRKFRPASKAGSKKHQKNEEKEHNEKMVDQKRRKIRQPGFSMKSSGWAGDPLFCHREWRRKTQGQG
jgi:hypothetical protein